MRFISASLFIAFTLAAAPTVQAQIYKWVDKDGKTQYSDTPPPSTESKRVDTIRTQPTATSAAPAAPSYVEAEKGFQKRKQEAQETQKKTEEKTAQAKDQNARCSEAKGNLATLTEGGRVFRTNEKGERTYMEDNEREAEMAKVKKFLADNCKG